MNSFNKWNKNLKSYKHDYKRWDTKIKIWKRQLKETSRACEIALTLYVHEISPGSTKRMRQRKFLNIKVQVLSKN